MTAERDDKGDTGEIEPRKKFVPDIVGPRYVDSVMPSLFCKSLVPAFDWSKRNSVNSSEDVAVKSKGWTNKRIAMCQNVNSRSMDARRTENYVAMV